MNSYGFSQTAVSQERIQEINSRCWAISDELSNAGQFVSVDKVLTVLLQRYGVVDFSQLMCGELSGVPTLALLMEINRKVDTYLSTRFAMASIVTLIDLEWECIQYLQGFEVPTLYSLQPKQAVCLSLLSTGGDPNEVDLDDNDQPGDTESETDHTISHFKDYGVGLLLHHSIVWSYFGGFVSAENTQDCCSHERVLQILIEYLSEQKWQHNTNKFSSFVVDEFMEFMCAELSISHPAEAGILIRGNLHAERMALEHVVKNRYTLYVETTKRELEHFNQQMQLFQGSNRKSAKKRRKRATDELTDVAEEDKEEEVEAEVEQTEQQEEGVKDSGAFDNEGETNVVHVPEPVVAETAASLLVPETADLISAPAAAQSKGKAVLASNPPYEASMNVYLPSGLPSITSNGAFKAGISHCGDADPGIKIVENWELQPILPFVNIDSGFTSTDVTSTTTSQVDTAWVQSAATHTFNATMDGRAAGRWGEALVYHYLLTNSAPGSHVNWLNLTEESRACYDFIVTAPVRSHHAQLVASRTHYHQDSDCMNAAIHNNNNSNSAQASSCGGRESTAYIEVKSTRFADRNVFEISPNEWQFAAADSRVPYHVYRVFSAGDPQRVRLVIIEDIFRKVTEGRLKLCMAV